jgi:alkylated DNA repair dioxygenase AlkB
MTLLLNRDGELSYIEDYLALAEADRMLSQLTNELAFETEECVMAGRRIRVPRRVCWYGDPEACYRYSGVDHIPKPWPPVLAALRGRLEVECGQAFNSVLGNLYRDGQDSMGWHADDERELGRNPVIASLSLGSERRFDLRHTASGEILHLPLAHGSLLIMRGRFQHHWRHRIPRQPGLLRPRINLTFRLIHPRD